MSPAPWLCAAGKQLRTQINARFPHRDTQSDGWVGDAAHAASKSDHNPDALSGIVRAIDIDEDLYGVGRPDPEDANRLVQELVASGDPRLLYLIFEGFIYSRVRHFAAKKYTGPNAHAHHIHVSFTRAGDSDFSPFRIPMLGDKPGLARGDSGPAVMQLQGALTDLCGALKLDGRDWPGFSPQGLDGVFGPQTERAVKCLQAVLAIEQSGVVGDAERDALGL